VLLLLSVTAAVAAATTLAHKNMFITDADMDIHTYDTLVDVSDHPANVRIHLRFICEGPVSSGSVGVASTGKTESSSSSTSSSSIRVHGFASAFPLTEQPPRWAPANPHFVPMDIQRHLNVSISSK
jgi:hypothetical protein